MDWTRWSGTAPPPAASWSQLLTRARDFELQIDRPRPSVANWLEAQALTAGRSQSELTALAAQSYPLIHEDGLRLCRDFLNFKREHGHLTERTLYQGMDELDLVERLLSKRPLSFVNSHDQYTLRNGREGANDWTRVGSDNPPEHLSMYDYMTYDEIQLAAPLIQVSSPVLPINNGSRFNEGRVDKDHVERAFYVGCVGARFERTDGRMEYAHMVVTPEQNRAGNPDFFFAEVTWTVFDLTITHSFIDNGYGVKRDDDQKNSLLNLWAQFYRLPRNQNFHTFDDCQTDHSVPGIVSAGPKSFFNSQVYRLRMEHTLEMFLLEANARGESEDKDIFAHMVGLGLGVWTFLPDVQMELYLLACQNVVERLPLTRIKTIRFGHMKCVSFRGSKICHEGTHCGVKFLFSNRAPFDKLPVGLDESSTLIVAMYAWDGNAFPGNEYWNGELSASGDPAAACCTQIPELQNFYINPRISSENLHVASRDFGVLHISHHAKKRLSERH